MDGPWRFRYFAPEEQPIAAGREGVDVDDSAWRVVDVPSHWQMLGHGVLAPGAPAGDSAWYRRKVQFPHREGQRLFLRMEGVGHAADAYLDGELVGRATSAFTPSEFDITDHAEPGGEALLAIRVHSRTRDAAFDGGSFWALGGLGGSVSLVARPEVRLDSIAVHTRFFAEDAAGLLVVEANLHGAAPDSSGWRLEAVLRERGVVAAASSGSFVVVGTEAGPRRRARASLSLDAARPWTAETPNLYDLELALLLDGRVMHRVEKRVGLRELAWRDGEFWVNGSPAALRGVVFHGIDPEAGRVATPGERRQRLEAIKAAHANFVRFPVPPHPLDLALCDEIGLYAMVGIPLWAGALADANSSYLSELFKRADAVVSEWRNHASIVAWAVGDGLPYEELVELTLQHVRRLDPDRPASVPMRPSQILQAIDALPRDLDFAAPLSPTHSELIRIAGGTEIPIIFPEYELDDRGRELWDLSQRMPRAAGGAIAPAGTWHRIEWRTGLPVPTIDLEAVARLYDPIRLDAEPQGYILRNGQDFLALSGAELIWRFEPRDGEGRSGGFDLPEIRPRGSLVLPVPEFDQPGRIDLELRSAGSVRRWSLQVPRG